MEPDHSESRSVASERPVCGDLRSRAVWPVVAAQRRMASCLRSTRFRRSLRRQAVTQIRIRGHSRSNGDRPRTEWEAMSGFRRSMNVSATELESLTSRRYRCLRRVRVARLRWDRRISLQAFLELGELLETLHGLPSHAWRSRTQGAPGYCVQISEAQCELRFIRKGHKFARN